ncbi:unnamed protein product [Darwinula stevensoni]|uniref:Transmembrane protein n=1 Tax=Darwinula stevensoni TaxID=69355 RepID=A0A7R8ZZQ6_9CRUS|nr:unnamed protein product [Darwinula stevensoni]CAG0884218.1 unnamed protein product [Darwinula stevensoni]
MSGRPSAPVYQPTTVAYDVHEDVGRVYLRNFQVHRSAVQRYLPAGIFFCGLMLSVLAICFVIVGGTHAGYEDSTSTGISDDFQKHSHNDSQNKTSETENGDHKNMNVTTHESDRSDGESSAGKRTLIAVGIPMLIIGGLMMTYALYMQGYLRRCFPGKHGRYSKQLSKAALAPQSQGVKIQQGATANFQRNEAVEDEEEQKQLMDESHGKTGTAENALPGLKLDLQSSVPVENA